MCGIILVFDKKNKIVKQEVEVLRDEMIHRGPDDAGIFINDHNNLALGHRRLSILELSKSGHQPMEKDNSWIIFNGEIYNYIELARKYNIDISKNHSDTYVLINLLKKQNEHILNQLNGMWGLVLYDESTQQIFISRDRYRKKPLYYYEDENVFIVSSEIKPILKSKYYEKEICQESVDLYLKTGIVDGQEKTFFKNINRFPKASFAKYSLQKKEFLEITEFYTIEESIHEVSDNEKENIEKFKELFIDAVRIRMRSDVEVGTCLSGGLDSSSIYCVASDMADDMLQSFSSRFKEDGYDEGYFIDKVIQKYPGKNHFIFPEYKDFNKKIRDIIYYLEEPSKAMGVYPQWHVMELASQHLKVLLDGQGGDEILAGYDGYYKFFLADEIRTNPRNFLKEIIGLYRIKGFEMVKRIPRSVLSVFVRNGKQFNGSYLTTKLIYDVYKNMLPALVKYEDKLGMAFSIEARMPFLDYRLVNFAFSLDNKYKINNGWNKSVLRKSMKCFLPKEVTYRKDKKGFPTPFNKILEENKFLEKYIPPNITDEWVKWRYVSLGIWKEVFFKD